MTSSISPRLASERRIALFVLLLMCATSSAEQQRRRERSRRMEVAPLNVYLLIKDQFDRRRGSIEEFVFQSLDVFSTLSDQEETDQSSTSAQSNIYHDRDMRPSQLYTYNAFFESLRTMSVDGIMGKSYHVDTNPYVPGRSNPDNTYVDDASNLAFFLSQDDPSNANAVKYAIVNVCAFLANAMVESIQFDACEEFNGMVYGGMNSGIFAKEGVTSMTATTGNDNNNIDERMLKELNGVDGRYFPMAKNTHTDFVVFVHTR